MNWWCTMSYYRTMQRMITETDVFKCRIPVQEEIYEAFKVSTGLEEGDGLLLIFYLGLGKAIRTSGAVVSNISTSVLWVWKWMYTLKGIIKS